MNGFLKQKIVLAFSVNWKLGKYLKVKNNDIHKDLIK